MARDAKTRPLEYGGAAVDRISNLPGSLIDLILERLPIQDAARTSILSKTWRNIWGMHPILHLDKKFISQLVSQKFSRIDEQTQVREVSRTISNIFLAHNGPILNFLLYIPQNLPFHQSSDMVLWIKNISNNGVRKVNLYNTSLIYWKVPSYFFSCSELTHLSLTGCTLNPPLGFGGFCNLISVDLMNVVINADISFGTKLKDLDMELCIGIKHLGCQFECNNNLIELSIVDCKEIDWKWFKYAQKLQSLYLILDEVPNSGKGMINLDKMVGNMPQIRALYLDGIFLTILKSGAAIMKRLSRAMGNLESLYLHWIELNDLVQIQYVLCLIRSSPNLREFNISLGHEIQSTDGMDVLDLVVLSDHRILDRLETLVLWNLVGSRAEFQFIKFLLACSPSLEWIKFTVVVDDPTEKLRILQEVLQIPRASQAAQIEWEWLD